MLLLLLDLFDLLLDVWEQLLQRFARSNLTYSAAWLVLLRIL